MDAQSLLTTIALIVRTEIREHRDYWQYRMALLDIDDSMVWDIREEWLDLGEMGTDGWELIAVLTQPEKQTFFGEYHNVVRVVFKRKRIDR